MHINFKYHMHIYFVIGVFFLGSMYHLAQPRAALSRQCASSCVRCTQKHKQLQLLTLVIITFECYLQIFIDSQRRPYLSRWKLIMQDYNALCARLLDSAGLPEETNLALYVINQTTPGEQEYNNV